MTETIVAAAVLICNQKVIAHLPAPHRHHDILHALYFAKVETPGPEWQGFLTSTGRYVGREEAVHVALRANQIKLPKLCHPQDQLFSEDLWTNHVEERKTS